MDNDYGEDDCGDSAFSDDNGNGSVQQVPAAGWDCFEMEKTSDHILPVHPWVSLYLSPPVTYVTLNLP